MATEILGLDPEKYDDCLQMRKQQGFKKQHYNSGRGGRRVGGR